MAKRVLVMSKHRDVIKEDYASLVDMFKKGVIEIKHSAKNKSFSLLKLDMNSIGLLWFISRDYSALINDPNVFDNDVMKVFEFKLDNKGFDYAPIKQCEEIIKLFNLKKPGQVYFKFVIESEESINLIGSYMEATKNLGEVCNKFQVDFSTKNLNEILKIQLASKLNLMGSKYGTKVNSCNFPELESKNIWIGNDPCISGYVMQSLLDMKMMKIRQNDSCACHKHTDIYGCGEFFRPGIDKIRESDLNRGKLKKVNILTARENKPSKSKENTNKPKVKATAKKNINSKVDSLGDLGDLLL